MYLRVLIYTQVTWIVVVGMLCRGVIIVPDPVLESFPPVVEKAVEIIVVCALYGFPLLTVSGICGSKLSTARKLAVLGAEAGLTATYFLALLPAVQ